MTAERALRVVRDVGQMPNVPPPEELLRQWGQWIRAAGGSERTVSTRVKGVRSLSAHARTDPTLITEAQLIDWLAGCKSQWTRHTYAVTARQWHRWLVARGYRDDDPTAELPKTAAPKGTPRPADTEALYAVLSACGRRTRAYITLAAYEGLRVHEVAKIRGEDFSDGWLYVRGKGDKPAALPIAPEVEQLRRGWPAEGYWFPSRERDHVKPDAVSGAVSAAFRKHGHNITAHQLRHWFGTMLQRTPGADIRTTQELMRHASLASTQIYTEVSSSSKVAAVRRLGR